MHSNNQRSVLSVIGLDAVMVASIDALRSTADHVTEKDRDGNKEPSCSRGSLEGE